MKEGTAAKRHKNKKFEQKVAKVTKTDEGIRKTKKEQKTDLRYLGCLLFESVFVFNLCAFA